MRNLVTIPKVFAVSSWAGFLLVKEQSFVKHFFEKNGKVGNSEALSISLWFCVMFRRSNINCF